MTDDQDGSEIPATAPGRHIPVYVSVPVVLVFGLIGYGLSLLLPLQQAPAKATTTPAPTTKAAKEAPSATLAGRQASPPLVAKPAAAFDPPARLGRTEPVAAPDRAPSPAPVTAVETGSVQHPPQRAALPAGDKTAARPTEAPEAARAEPQSSVADPQPGAKRAEGVPRKRVRRVYRPRIQPKTAKGPFETLFPALAK